MPPLSSHFRLAACAMPALGIVSHVGPFVLGTTAPDAFEPDSEESFSQHHFHGSDKQISLQSFLKSTNFIPQPSEDPLWSFLCGYYSHLWLDAWYRDGSHRVPFRRPADLSDTDLRSLLRRETEIINAPFVLSFEEEANFGLEHLLMPAGLEFVNLDRCTGLFHEVLTQSQAWVQLRRTFVALDEARYTTFFRDVSRSFMDEMQSAV